MKAAFLLKLIKPSERATIKVPYSKNFAARWKYAKSQNNGTHP